MAKLSQIVILNVYKRESEGKYLKKLIEISARKYGIPVQISMDDGTLGVWENYKNALTMKSEVEGTHRMIVHDDVSFERNVLEKILYILDHAPQDEVISFFSPNNNDYQTAIDTNHHVVAATQNWWAPAMVFPNHIAQDIIDKMSVMSNGLVKTEDTHIIAYLQYFHKYVYSILPTLIQHMGAFRSTHGTQGKIGKYVRYSLNYNSQFKVQDVDWEKEFANPYYARMAQDRTREVMHQEFLEEYKDFYKK